MNRCFVLAVATGVLSFNVSGQTSSFVNWENPHVHPLDITPDGTRLLAVNTADNRLEVFNITTSGAGGGNLTHAGSIPVGLEPISVRARSNEQAWVVNHISDSVSVVDLMTQNVVATLMTADEPCDVVFAGPSGELQRAFVTCSQANRVQVFNPLNMAAAPISIAIVGEDPRAMAVSPDGTKVYVAIFESGNGTTILGGGATTSGFFPPNVVSHPSGPYGGQNPPPNSGATFDPPLNPNNPPPPPVGLIVRKTDDGTWLDDNGGDWAEFVNGSSAGLSGRPVGWDLWDHDVAVIDAQTLEVSYRTRLMNLCMALAVNPATGQVTVVGTEAMNQVRFESNLNGRFLRTQIALVEASAGTPAQIIDLNPHLDYTGPSIPRPLRDLSIGDPRAIVWNAGGTAGYVTGMGSNNVIVVNATGQRAQAEPIEVGQGPTGVALDQAGSLLYVLNRFDATISVVDVAKHIEVRRVSFFDPTPASIRLGRPHLYDAHSTSGLGHISCASCHPDGRMDRLAWDLGDPARAMIQFDQNCNFGSATLGSVPCSDWHPMKGPMVTQTLQDIIGKEPHHWRGDRDGIEEFNQTFTNLQGADEELTATEMQKLEDFLATITLPPNPFRNLNNALPATLPLPGQYYTGVGGEPGTPLPDGNAAIALSAHFLNHHLVQGFGVTCSTCHTLPTGVGTNSYIPSGGGGLVPFPPGPNGELHHAVVFSNLSETPSMSIKVPHLRNLHEKVGFEMTQTRSLAGFGFLHDGSVDSLSRFMGNPPFVFNNQLDGPPEVKVPRMVALMMAFSGSGLPPGSTPGGPLSRDTHAAVGRQVTFNSASADPALIAQLNALMAIADGPRVSLVAKGLQQNLARGYAYVGGGQFQSDRLDESLSASALISGASNGAEVTFTAVPDGTETRVGIDRDEDGFFDRDELDAGSDPADPNSIPTAPGDINGDGIVNVIDLLAVIGTWGPCPAPPNPCPADIAPSPNGDGIVDVNDLLLVIANWG